MDLIKVVEQAFANEKVATYPKFKAGDTVTVTYRIKEGDKDRLQKFRGVVIQLRGATSQSARFQEVSELRGSSRFSHHSLTALN